MNLSLETKIVRLPFRQTFSHSSATRDAAESIFVRIVDEDGVDGIGEGCPRSYVTGENPETCVKFLEGLKRELNSITTPGEVKKRGASAIRSGNPSAWCAFELAWLNYYATRAGKPLEEFLGLSRLSPPFHYSAVLGLQPLASFVKSVNVYQSLEFTDFKVKISGVLKDDNERLGALKKLIGAPLRLRLDANNCFSSVREVLAYFEKLEVLPWAIEEPLKDPGFAELAEIARNLKLKIIVDESFTEISAINKLAENPGYWICNLRLSKLGGLLAALAIAEAASKAELSVIVGCHVGESSVLTRAALAVINMYAKQLAGTEGAFGTHLLERDVTDDPIMFGKKGVLADHRAFHQPGLGITTKIF